jgi:hypothetical protein
LPWKFSSVGGLARLFRINYVKSHQKDFSICAFADTRSSKLAGWKKCLSCVVCNHPERRILELNCLIVNYVKIERPVIFKNIFHFKTHIMILFFLSYIIWHKMNNFLIVAQTNWLLFIIVVEWRIVFRFITSFWWKDFISEFGNSSLQFV